ncbi:MAG: hypothetical protein HOA30_00355 [Rhodospirillaceae bacterium]|nr:hypothetical protein [Rhodospirillaceae bacterium]
MIGMILYTVSAFGLGCFLPGGRAGALSYGGIKFFPVQRSLVWHCSSPTPSLGLIFG